MKEDGSPFSIVIGEITFKVNHVGLRVLKLSIDAPKDMPILFVEHEIQSPVDIETQDVVT